MKQKDEERTDEAQEIKGGPSHRSLEQHQESPRRCAARFIHTGRIIFTP
jgi:hypothetical protein